MKRKLPSERMACSNREDGKLSSCVEALSNDNKPEEFMEAAQLIVKIATNIIDEPNNSKYRSLRLANSSVDKKLMPVNGALECLFEMGFEENDEYLTLPGNAPLANVIKVADQIKSRMAQSKRQPDKEVTNNRPVAYSNLPTFQQSEEQLHNKLKSNLNHVQMYEDAALQRKALSLIPIQEFTKKPEYPCENTTGEVDNSENPDVILLKLLSWFKHSFFSWTDKPKCSSCGKSENSAIGLAHPTSEELRWLAHVVELHKCNKCGTITRFPRYNHPEKLLETRTGRCGEYANCFTFMCRAFGFEARFVLDLTDHVWTEVFSTVQNRWLHCDPCENICDLPLTYEQGWKKNLSYVFAFSKNQVMDVTWRYTKDHMKTLERRKLCRESWLLQVINNMNKELQSNLPSTDVEKLKLRYIKELVEFLTPVTENGTELGGRISGSLEWRLLRGETEQKPETNERYTFKLTEFEKNIRRFHLRYCPESDQYIRLSNNKEITSGFSSCVIWQKNMFRKVENDWGMVYLARKPSESRGTMCWAFHFQESGLCFRNMSLRVFGTTFHSGKIEVKILIDARIIPISIDTDNTLVESIEFENKFMLCAEVSGGDGDNAWQHAQLFRQKLHSKDYSFEIVIDFMKDGDGEDLTDDCSE